MKPTPKTAGTLNRRSVIVGAMASTAAVASWHGVLAQGTPQASPAVDNGIDVGALMTVSTGLCGGATINEENADTLLGWINSQPGAGAAFEELAGVEEFTEEAIAGVSPEAQALAGNILQFWFLGRINGEPVENRADLFFSFACWQALPYSTQPSTCKSFGYWAVEIES